jgi:hypothetical protein
MLQMREGKTSMTWEGRWDLWLERFHPHQCFLHMRTQARMSPRWIFDMIVRHLVRGWVPSGKREGSPGHRDTRRPLIELAELLWVTVTRSLVRGLFRAAGSKPTRQMMMTVTLAVTRARSSETKGLYLSCSLPFWHLLTKGERGKIEMFLLSSSSFVLMVVAWW